MQYPQIFVDMSLAISSFLALDFFSFLPSTLCSFATRSNLYWTKLLIYTLTPVVLSSALLAYYMFFLWRIRRQTRGNLEARQRRCLELKSNVMFVFLLFTFIIFTSVSTAVVSTFHTVTFADGSCFLRRDLTTRCDDATFRFWSIYASIFVTVYPIGASASRESMS